MHEDDETLWNAVLAAEVAHGETAEAFVRAEGLAARDTGDAELEGFWNCVAEELHILQPDQSQVGEAASGCGRPRRRGSRVAGILD